MLTLMSVSRAEDMDHGDPAYHEIEVQSIKSIIEHGTGEQGTQNQVRSSTEVLGPDGMDRDMLAELVAARFKLETHLEDHNEVTNTTPGAAQARTAFGINIGRGDSVLFVENSQGWDNQEHIEGDRSQVAFESEEVDDPGTLFEGKLTSYAAFNDTASGTGGGGTNNHMEEFVNFRDFLETGPVVDATDDLVCIQRQQHDAVSGQSVNVFYAQLYWATYDVEGARPQFGL